MGEVFVGSVPANRRFYLAFQFGENWEQNSAEEPIDFDILADLSDNNWSRDGIQGTD